MPLSSINSFQYHDELKQSGVYVTKPVLFALINSYANCGMFDKAKQVGSVSYFLFMLLLFSILFLL